MFGGINRSPDCNVLTTKYIKKPLSFSVLSPSAQRKSVVYFLEINLYCKYVEISRNSGRKIPFTEPINRVKIGHCGMINKC